MTRPSEARHAASSQLARSVSLHTRSTDGVFGHQRERNLSPRHGAGRASVPRGGRGSRGSRGNRVWAPRGRGEAERVPTPCTRFPVGSSARLESRGVEISKRRGRISQISQLASQGGFLLRHDHPPPRPPPPTSALIEIEPNKRGA